MPYLYLINQLILKEEKKMKIKKDSVSEDIYGRFIKFAESNFRDPNKENGIHVTSIAGSPLCSYYETKKNYDLIEINLNDLVATMIGTAVHAILENLADPSEELVEIPLQVEFLGLGRIIGRFDWINNLSFDEETQTLHGTLNDFKTITVAGAQRVISDGPKHEWVEQVNIYKYILETHFLDNKDQIAKEATERGADNKLLDMIINAQSFKVDGLYIQMIAKDWSKLRARKMPNYMKSAYQRIALPVIPNEKIEEILVNRLAQFKHMDNYYPPDELMWEKPWALMRKGKNIAVKLMTTSEKNEYEKSVGLKPDEYWEFRGIKLIQDPEQIKRCAYCPAFDVCHGKYYIKTLLKEGGNLVKNYEPVRK